MAAPNMLAVVVHLLGMECHGVDACGAYTQRDFKGDATWVELPPHQWLAAWHRKYNNPVVTLIKAL